MKKEILLIASAALSFGVLSGCSEEKDTKELSTTPYITRVLGYFPAPGQFVNNLPVCVAGDTQEMMNAKVLAAIGENRQGMITLGGFGGYVVVGFDHAISNVSGERDFLVSGNAFKADASSEKEQGGSAEPGIVMVSVDVNGNGNADDEWYELAGSEYHKSETKKSYTVNYIRPEADKEPVTDPTDPHTTDAEYIAWRDNEGNRGYMPKIVFHRQNYYPDWINDDQLTFTGTLLAPNAVKENDIWIQYPYAWGYVDNYPNDAVQSTFDIDWAVDSQGKRVHLSSIDFIKIYTAVHQNCGWIGESSTEVTGVTDLHIKK